MFRISVVTIRTTKSKSKGKTQLLGCRSGTGSTHGARGCSRQIFTACKTLPWICITSREMKTAIILEWLLICLEVMATEGNLKHDSCWTRCYQLSQNTAFITHGSGKIKRFGHILPVMPSVSRRRRYSWGHIGHFFFPSITHLCPILPPVECSQPRSHHITSSSMHPNSCLNCRDSLRCGLVSASPWS